MVVHTGGVCGDKAAAQAQFCRNFARLPPAVQARMALENDDRFGLSDVLWIHRQTGVRWSSTACITWSSTRMAWTNSRPGPGAQHLAARGAAQGSLRLPAHRVQRADRP
ncbi:MAG: hypothetical protein IPM84_15005 [Anaerolineae bacterium]|nr:hypothetical protein [Anaerolineae bacterium]